MTRHLERIPESFRQDVERAVQILRGAGCEKVYLFGSLVEGALSAVADIDLAVRGCPPGKFFRLQGRLLMELDHPVDLVDLDKDAQLASFLQSEGRLLDVA